MTGRWMLHHVIWAIHTQDIIYLLVSQHATVEIESRNGGGNSPVEGLVLGVLFPNPTLSKSANHHRADSFLASRYGSNVLLQHWCAVSFWLPSSNALWQLCAFPNVHFIWVS